MKARLALGIASGFTALLIAVATTRADPNLGNIPAHRHFVKTPDGTLVPVGPNLCDNPDLQKAFNQFHNNIHVVSSVGIGPAAPGLHNGVGAELMAGRC
jgi:hypothetical protein